MPITNKINSLFSSLLLKYNNEEYISKSIIQGYYDFVNKIKKNYAKKVQDNKEKAKKKEIEKRTNAIKTYNIPEGDAQLLLKNTTTNNQSDKIINKYKKRTNAIKQYEIPKNYAKVLLTNTTTNNEANNIINKYKIKKYRTNAIKKYEIIGEDERKLLNNTTTNNEVKNIIKQYITRMNNRRYKGLNQNKYLTGELHSMYLLPNKSIEPNYNNTP